MFLHGCTCRCTDVRLFHLYGIAASTFTFYSSAAVKTWRKNAEVGVLVHFSAERPEDSEKGSKKRDSSISSIRCTNQGITTMLQKGPRPIVFCGPSGSGKSTLIKLLFDEFPDNFGFSVSHTTRKPRPGEEDGKHYYFTSKEDMEQQIKQGEFLETASFSGNLYGTSKRAVEDVQRAGKICILDIETEGVKQIKNSTLNPVFIFIKPPSIQELEKRLVGRKTETNESLQRRLSYARSEIEFGEAPGNFDLVIENDNVEKAYQKLKDFIVKKMNQQKQNIN